MKAMHCVDVHHGLLSAGSFGVLPIPELCASKSGGPRVRHTIPQQIPGRVAVARMGAVREGDKLVAGAAWQKVRPASLPTLMRKVWKLAEPVLTNQSARHAQD